MIAADMYAEGLARGPESVIATGGDSVLADSVIQQWHALNMPLQQPLEDRNPGEWWADMDELFHLD